MRKSNWKLPFMFLVLIHLYGLIGFGCNANYSAENLIGVYVSHNGINNIDTLKVLDDGTYINLIYRKKDSSLVYRNTGKWETRENYIILHNLFTDEDDEHGYEFDNFNEVLITSQLPIEENHEGKIIIRHKSMYHHIYLEKIQ